MIRHKLLGCFAYGDLIDEEVEALREQLLAIRIRGGTTCGLMRMLGTMIINHLLVSNENMEMEDVMQQLPNKIETLKEDYNQAVARGEASLWMIISKDD